MEDDKSGNPNLLLADNTGRIGALAPKSSKLGKKAGKLSQCKKA